MEKEWIDIADTAVKIGLGSLITGVFTFIGLRHNSKTQKDKFNVEHKTKLLERIAEDTQEYFAAWSSLLALVNGIAATAPPGNELEMDEETYERLSNRDKELVKTWKLRGTAISMLRLLKATSAVTELIECWKCEKKLRDLLFINEGNLTTEDVEQIVNETAVLQQKFHDEMANFYEKVTS